MRFLRKLVCSIFGHRWVYSRDSDEYCLRCGVDCFSDDDIWGNES